MKSPTDLSRSILVGRACRVLLVTVALIFVMWLLDRHVVFGGTLAAPFHGDASSPYAQLSLPGRRPLAAFPSITKPVALSEGRLDIVLEPPRTFQTADIQLSVNSCVDTIVSGPAPFGLGIGKDVEFYSPAFPDREGCLTNRFGFRIPLELIGNDQGVYRLTLKPANAGERIILTGITITFEGQPISWSRIVHWLKKL